MVRKSLVVVALIAIGTPASAQDHVWSSRRPDAEAPLGVTGARTLLPGQIHIGYRFSQMNLKGVWFGNDSIGVDETLSFYQVAPLSLTNQTHRVDVSIALTRNFTVAGNWSLSKLQREHLTGSNVFYVTEVRSLGDPEVMGIYSIFDEESPYRADIQVGGRIPFGESSALVWGPFGARWAPYDQRVGGGTFAVMPGLTVQTQNQVASVGAQVKGDFSIGTNGSGYARGNRFEASGWAAYRINEFFSVSARMHWQNWGGIRGGDARLNPLQDPGNDGFFLEGERVDFPLGVNFQMPEGMRFAGHRVAIEAIFPVHHEYEGPQLGADWGVTVGWQAPLEVRLPRFGLLGGDTAEEEDTPRNEDITREVERPREAEMPREEERPREEIAPAEDIAREEYVAREDHFGLGRPDAASPLGVAGTKATRPGALEFNYRFSQTESKGVWVGSDSIGVAATLLAFTEAPLSLTNQTHTIGLAYAAMDGLTLSANWSLSKLNRQQRTGAGVIYGTEVRALGDVEVMAQYGIFGQASPYQVYVQVGGRIPVGNENAVVWGPSGSTWAPYDMRVAGGTFALLPGVTVKAQHRLGSIGAQFKADISRGTNDLGYTRGDRLEATAWAAYRINDLVSVSGRVKWQRTDPVRGADARLNTVFDPGNSPGSTGGIRVDVPVGVNILMPEGSPVAGHRLSVEAFMPVLHDYAAPQLGAHWGVSAAWQAPIPLAFPF